MKFRKIWTKILAVGLCFCLLAGLAACGSVSESNDDETDETEEAADDDSEEEEEDETTTDLILSLDDGTEIQLSEFGEDEAYIYGKFIYESDGSVWVFGGDSLSVAYYNTDDELDMDLYDVGFYEAVDADEDYSSYLYIVLTDIFEGTSACWYALNVTDDDDNLVAVALVNPSDEDVIYYLSVYEDDDDDDDDSEE